MTCLSRRTTAPAIDSVLVTGAFGLVGSAVVKQLLADNRRVVATAHHIVNAAPADLYGVEVRWVDLTKPAQVDALVAGVSLSAIVHLAAITPPQCYAHRALARAVNVDATAVLVRAAAAQRSPPRFVHASSAAVYGARNPHRFSDVLTADTPIAPSDLYGGHKAEAEKIVRSSDLEWSVLRLGGALSVEPIQQASLDAFYFDALLPADGRLHTVDVRDVARAFCAATTTDAVRELFMIAGDDSHKRLQGEVARAVAAAVGLAGGLPIGRPGDPNSDCDWYPTDWMDTTRSQQVLCPVDAAVSKPVDLPSTATVDDVRAIYLAGWKAKVKGLAVYRYCSAKDRCCPTPRRNRAGAGRGVQRRLRRAVLRILTGGPLG